MQICPACKTILDDSASVCDCGAPLTRSAGRAPETFRAAAREASDIRVIAADIRAIRNIAIAWFLATALIGILWTVNWAIEYKSAEKPAAAAAVPSPKPSRFSR